MRTFANPNTIALAEMGERKHDVTLDEWRRVGVRWSHCESTAQTLSVRAKVRNKIVDRRVEHITET